MKKRKVRVTNTGYLPNSPDRNNPMNIIPSNQITMKNVPFPIMGIDNLGNQQMMMPGMNYTFPGQYVTEIPMGKYQKGGLVKYQNKGQVNPKSKGWREYKTPTGESLYLDPRFKDQRYYVNEKGDHVTPNQNMSLYDVTDNIWESGTSLPPLEVSPKYKYVQRPGALGAMETIRMDLDNGSQEITSPDVMATKREMDAVANATINPAGLLVTGIGNIAQGNIVEGTLQTALSIPVVGQAVGKVIGAPFKFIGNELASTYGPVLSEVGRLAITKTPLRNAYNILSKGTKELPGSSNVDDVVRLESEIAALKNQEIANENIRKNLWADYKAGKITGEEYNFKANKLFESQGGWGNPRYGLEKQLRELKIKNDIANTPQQNILQSESQLGKNISTGGSNTKGVFELGDDYVARLSSYGYDDASRLVNYQDKITSPRVAKTLQVKEIDGKVYQVQQKATGKPLNQLSQEELSNIPKEHINNFWKDKAELDNLGLNIDVSGGKSNIFYDPKKGFQLIDLGIGESTLADDIIITNPILKPKGLSLARTSSKPKSNMFNKTEDLSDETFNITKTFKGRSEEAKTIPRSIDITGKSGNWQLNKNANGTFSFSATMTNPVESGRAMLKMDELMPPKPTILEEKSYSLDSWLNHAKLKNRPHWSGEFNGYIPLNHSAVHNKSLAKFVPEATTEYSVFKNQTDAEEALQIVNDLIKKQGITQEAKILKTGDTYQIQVPNFKLTRDYKTGGVKFENGGLVKYQGDQGASQVVSAGADEMRVPTRYPVIRVTDPNDPKYLEYQKLKRLHEWSNIQDTDFKRMLIDSYLNGEEDSKYLGNISDSKEMFKALNNIDPDFFSEMDPRDMNLYFTEDTGPYGSKKEVKNFKTKQELNKFLASKDKGRFDRLQYDGLYYKDDLAPLIKKYNPIGYQYEHEFDYPSTTFLYEHDRGNGKWIAPDNQLIEDEINRDLVKEIYPTYTDKEMDDDAIWNRNHPYYITNYTGKEGSNIFFIRKQHQVDHLASTNQLPKVLKSIDAWGMPDGVKGYLPESIKEHIQSGYMYYPIFGTPESYLGSTYEYDELPYIPMKEVTKLPINTPQLKLTGVNNYMSPVTGMEPLYIDLTDVDYAKVPANLRMDVEQPMEGQRGLRNKVRYGYRDKDGTVYYERGVPGTPGYQGKFSGKPLTSKYHFVDELLPKTEDFQTVTLKKGGMYLGKYEFKDGGLVKMAPGGANPGRYSGKLTIDDFNKIVGQAPEPTETFIPFRNEEPSKNISEFMGKKTSVSRDLQNEKKIEDKVRKYESSSEFQLGQNVYRDPKTHINQYEKTADYKLRHKNISDYNSDDVKQIQKKLVDEGLIKSSQINLSDYKTKDDVKELQRFLVSQGLADHLGKYGENKDGVDGQLGKMTRAAVELYNKNNKGYDEGKLDDKTREAVKQFKAFSDAKKTTGVNIVDPFNLVDENGDPKIDETYSALQDYENQLNRSGYFKGNFKIDTSPITEYNKKIAYNFKINPDPTTPFGMCAQYVNGTVCREDVYGQDAREKLGFTGPAWHISDNIQNKGGSLLFAGLPERSTLKLKNKDEINAFVKNQLVKPETITALQSLVGDGNINSTSKVKPGDVVNIFYEGSSYAEEAYSQTAANNNRLFTTHVGIVKADDQGNLYVEHNIHGDVKKDPIGNFLTGKVKGNGRNKVSLISGITRPKYFNKVDANASLPIGGIEYYQTDEGQFNPEGVFATKDYLAQSVSGKQTYELLKTIEKNKKGLLKDIPITEGEFTKLLRVTRALPTLETYSKSQPLTQWEKDKKVLQDTFYKEKSMGITKLKDESNLGENLRKKLITSDEELDNPVKAALPTFYSLSKNYLYLKDVANKYKIDINTDELAKLAGISWNQSVSRIATELVKSGSYDDYVRYRESKAPDKKNFKYREVIDVYDTQTMRYGGTTQQQGIYLGKYEFKDGGLVKYQNKGEVDNTNVYINTNMYNDLYKNQELYRNMKNWDQPDVQEDSPYKSQYPLTYSLASGLKNVPRYKNTKTDDFFKLLNLIAAVESKDKNIPQMDGGPGRGYYQVEPPTATTAKNRAIQLQKDLKNYGYDLPLPEKFDTNFMNLSKDEQAFYALSNIIKAASAKRENDPNYNIDFTNPGKAWIDLHWAGKDSIRPKRVEHWNEINKDNKIALDENGNVILVKKQGGLVKAQEGKEMPFGLPLKEQNIYLLPEYNQPRNPMTGQILPDPQRPNLGMDTGATEYKYTYGSDEGDIDVPSIVAGQYIGDQALDRYMLTGERFKTMNDPGSYSKFYDQIRELGLMQEKKGGSVRKVKIKRAPRKNQ